MSENMTSTIKDRLHMLMRAGHLENLDKRIAKNLFSEVPVSALRKLLRDQYSVRMNASLTQRKAVEMCMMRFYKGSESSRQMAVRIFLEGGRNYLSRLEKDVNDELASVPVTLIDGDMDISGGSSQEGSEVSSTLSQPLSVSGEEILPSGSQENQQMVELRSPNRSGLVILGTDITLKPSCIFSDADSPARLNTEALLEQTTKMATESGMKCVALDVETLLLKDDVNGWRPLDKESADVLKVPTYLGLAEPAFFELKTCLVHFTVPVQSNGAVNTNSVTFNLPNLNPDEFVILSFRSVGNTRDCLQPDHPVGLICAMNDSTSTSCFTAVPQTRKPNQWTKKLTIFDCPIVLENLKSGSDNRLDFSFPRLPENVKYGSHYHGYVFIAKRRTVADTEKVLRPIAVRETLSLLISLILGPKGSLAPGIITVQLSCPIAFGPMVNPSRGVRCRHPNCFSAPNYLHLHQVCKDPRWKCVICGEVTQWYDLRTDKLMAFLIDEFPGCDKVDVSLDGTKMVFQGVPAEPDTDLMDE